MKKERTARVQARSVPVQTPMWVFVVYTAVVFAVSAGIAWVVCNFFGV